MRFHLMNDSFHLNPISNIVFGYASVTCAHTKYQSGWTKYCPICSHCGKLYESGSRGNDLDMKEYKKHKAKFHGYMPVLVVSDPTNPDNV